MSTNPLGLPDPFVWSNYTDILGGPLFWRPLLTSIVVAVLTVAIILVCACLAAFALARVGFRGRESVSGYFTLGLLFPGAVAIFPLYLMLRQLGLLDSSSGLPCRRRRSGCPSPS